MRLLVLLIVLAFSQPGWANVFDGRDKVLPLSGQIAYTGNQESDLPPADQDSVWNDVSGQAKLKQQGWYWLKFNARSSQGDRFAVFPVNPSLQFNMFERVNGVLENLEQKRIYKSGAWWGDFHLLLEEKREQTFFVKIYSPRIGYDTAVDVSLNPPQELIQKRTQTFIPWLIFVGLILSLIIYNSYLYIQTRDPFYLYYVSCEIFLHLTHLPGLVFMWNWVSPLGANYFLLNGIGILIGYSSLCLFLYHFARFSEYVPRWGRWLYFLTSLACVPFGISMLMSTPHGKLLPGLAVSCLGLLGGVLYVAAKSRSRNSIILCFSFAPIPVAAGIFIVSRLLGSTNETSPVYYLVSVLALEGLIMAIALADRIKQLEKKSREEESIRRKLEFELETADVFQRILLPAPLLSQGYETHPYYRPAQRNGGDWFTSYLDEKNDVLYVVILDVTGHGLTSAMLASVVSGVVLGQLEDKTFESNPSERLRHLAERVNTTLYKSSHKSGLLATGLFVALERRTGRLWFVNCAHPPFVVERNSVFEFVPSSGRRLGSGVAFDCQSIEMELGENGRLFVYTDGLMENTGPDGKNLTQRKLKSLLQNSRSQKPELASQAIHHALENLWRNQGERDDATFLIVDWARA
ncbi:MAG: hypothetical protein RLZZ488_2692 [Pseudomonadota bacterium]